MKKMLTILSAFLTAALLTACANTMSAHPQAGVQSSSIAGAAQYIKLSAKEAKAIMDSGEPFVLLDVRTKEEYLEKHIKGAVLVPNETIGAKQPEQLPDLDAQILVYCRSGNRSAQAAQKLLAIGYTNVKDFGGINSWPYETVSGEEA